MEIEHQVLVYYHVYLLRDIKFTGCVANHFDTVANKTGSYHKRPQTTSKQRTTNKNDHKRPQTNNKQP